MSMNSVLGLLCPALFAVLIAPVAAADGPRSDTTTGVAEFVGITSEAPAASTTNWNGGAQISTSTDQTSATLKIAKSYPNLTDNYAAFGNLGVTVTTPVTKTNATTTVPSLDGLTNAYTVKVQYSQYTTFVTKDTPEKRRIRSEICSEMRSAAAARETDEERKEAALALPCTGALITKYLGADKSTAHDSASPGPAPGGHVWGLAAKIGYEDFDYLSASAGSKITTSRVPWSVSGFLALNPVNTAFLGTISFEYQKAAKPGRAGAVCSSQGGVASPTCPVGAVGPPSTNQKELLSFEARYAFTKATIALTPTYDFKNKIFGLELPVYFVPGEKTGTLSGGVQVGWQTDTHKPSFGAVASVPLDTLF